MEMKWYAVYTKPNCEKKVSQILTQKKIINFCPTNRIIRVGKEGKINEEILFHSYVFVKALESQITEVKRIKGVINFIYWMQKPAIIDDNEITLIRRFVNDHVNVKIEKTGIDADQSHYINESQNGYQAKLVHLKSNRVKVILPSLGYVMFAEPDKSVIQFKPSEEVASSQLNYQYALTR